jgi:hypothetical protein
LCAPSDDYTARPFFRVSSSIGGIVMILDSLKSVMNNIRSDHNKHCESDAKRYELGNVRNTENRLFTRFAGISWMLAGALGAAFWTTVWISLRKLVLLINL